MLWEKGNVVEVTRDCEIGLESERAIVIDVDDGLMTLLFICRSKEQRAVVTGRDYRFLRTAL
jgi:hypothetical protein